MPTATWVAIRPYPEGCSVQVRSHKSGTKRFLVHIVAYGQNTTKLKESSPYEFLSILRKNPLNRALFFMAVDYQSLVWPPVAGFPPITRSLLRSNSEVGQDNYPVTMVAM